MSCSQVLTCGLPGAYGLSPMRDVDPFSEEESRGAVGASHGEAVA